ncbi:MAG: hypothetical protein NTY83_01320 [Candidatus Micrarchaeota archaeon]|nr:hypothetical protein [Candidatus Micrarchaeota archaeon]
MRILHPRQMFERRLDMVVAANELTKNGLHYGMKHMKAELLLDFKRNVPMIERLLVITESKTYKEAVEKTLKEKLDGNFRVEERGTKAVAEPNSPIANPVGLLIRIL